ncbi:retinoid-inducible serine carboxypeptidase-like [Penaeus chinensis]|uniref:retinoid-inducible serine carboxypeptidase-like n=1 Tax=Penaeus chinensis TaxID=139456 RepID=UPI001FB587E7|nr:retinoid-inducible serine carboxypeptidase-like [Penaeus chinensis]
MKLLLALAALLGAGLSAAAPLDEDYGYVTVRPGAHMFWVMYHTEQEGDYTKFPLIMWLQGGPGASGVGYGNFEELGPYDINGNRREGAWTKKANVMFVDNPVGTGYSYVDNFSDLTVDNAQIAADLVVLVKEAFKVNPDMERMPFYVYAESYGGKMTVDFALAFDQAIKNGEVVSDFRGVALGDSWISPMDSVNTWGMFLYQMGFVNIEGLQKVDAAALKTQEAVDAGRWSDATDEWSNTELVVMDVAHNVNFYNVLAEDDIYRDNTKPHSLGLSFMPEKLRRLYKHHVLSRHQTRDLLGDFMNGAQAEHWNIPPEVEWDAQGGMVFSALAGDFMKPVVDSVIQLLTETNLHVAVFTGNLDLICDTPGTYRWIENMEWPGKPNFTATDTVPIYISAYSAPAAFVQKSGQFSVYTILRSGHMVPIDAPEMALKMIDMITASTSKNYTPEKDISKVGQSPNETKEAVAKVTPKTKKASPRKAKQAGKSKGTPNAARAKVLAAHPNPATPTGKRLSKLVPAAKALH